MALAWKAGWVNALRGSNPLSSATRSPGRTHRVRPGVRLPGRMTGPAGRPMMGPMSDTPSTSPGPTGHTKAPETYLWPLVALVVVILPQLLVPARLREGPPVAVPVIEGLVFLILLAVAANPGPVPRGARPLVL